MFHGLGKRCKKVRNHWCRRWDQIVRFRPSVVGKRSHTKIGYVLAVLKSQHQVLEYFKKKMLYCIQVCLVCARLEQWSY